jgi:hypothetical protein
MGDCPTVSGGGRCCVVVWNCNAAGRELLIKTCETHSACCVSNGPDHPKLCRMVGTVGTVVEMEVGVHQNALLCQPPRPDSGVFPRGHLQQRATETKCVTSKITI